MCVFCFRLENTGTVNVQCIVVISVHTLNGSQGAVAHEGGAQGTAKATGSQAEQGSPGHTEVKVIYTTEEEEDAQTTEVIIRAPV